jgi:hypothetical protein
MQFYGFLEIRQKELPESRILPHEKKRKRLKQNSYQNGTAIAIRRVPVRYRLLEEFRPAQVREDTRQE